MTGEASQKAMTADNGTPMARRAAMSGITPQEQKGDSPPIAAANAIINSGDPVNAAAIRLSAPEARAKAARPTESAR